MMPGMSDTQNSSRSASSPARSASRLRSRFQHALAAAGLTLDGPRPWDPQIHDERLFARVAARGTLGLGDAYVDGWWDCERLDVFFDRVLRAGVDRPFRAAGNVLASLWARILNPQRPSRAQEVGRRHYDLGDDLFRTMLDRRRM